jgi:CBS domain containing-hemolysin-like protein
LGAFSALTLLWSPLFANFFLHKFSAGNIFDWIAIAIGIFVILALGFLIAEYLPRVIGTRFPEKALKFCLPPASLFLFLTFPIAFIFLKTSNSFAQSIYFDYMQEPEMRAKQEIIDMIQNSQLGPDINLHDKTLIEAVLSFRERIAREVMVPRVNVFSLSAETTIKEAAVQLVSEGFSRIPIYRNTVDNVVGVLMYKDVLAKFCEYEKKGNDLSVLEVPIETIQKSVLYIPETKKISSLLQEFRKKQVHLAIIVDEYGGTEGIVTIEDILEEIVGDIADEYDEEKQLLRSLPDGNWIVDAQMSIFDIEDQLNIEIPQDGDYDTLGGYIFHCAGSIPSRGFMIHQDAFELEVLKSNERTIEKVRVKPLRNRQ